jgi:hypothetical protein
MRPQLAFVLEISIDMVVFHAQRTTKNFLCRKDPAYRK